MACLRSWFRKRRKKKGLPASGYSLENKVSSRTPYRLFGGPKKSIASPLKKKGEVSNEESREAGRLTEEGDTVAKPYPIAVTPPDSLLFCYPFQFPISSPLKKSLFMVTQGGEVEGLCGNAPFVTPLSAFFFSRGKP